MRSSSTWDLHPDLATALSNGQTLHDWLNGRKPCCSYARITHDRREQLGVTRQHKNNDELASQKNCAIVYRYTDNHITAADPDIERPAFLAMVRDLRKRKTETGYPIQGVFVVEEERVVRLPEDYLKLYRALTADEFGVLGIYDTRQIIDMQSDAELIRGLFVSAQGEREVVRVKRRVKRSVHNDAISGEPFGSRRFGWKEADKKKERRANKELDKEESRVLREALEMALEGKSWTAILRFMEGTGFKTKRGKEWHIGAVQYMVTNPANCGYRIVNKELVKDPKTGEPVVGKWQTICSPEEWWQLISRCDIWFPLDGRDTPRDKYQKKLTQEGKKDYRAIAEASRYFFLTHIARCGYKDSEGNICGAKITGERNGSRRRLPTYRCSDRRCGRIGRRADLTDKAVEKVVIRVLERQFNQIKPEEKPWSGEEDLQRLLSKRREIREAYLNEAISIAEYLEFREGNEEKIQKLQSERDKYYAEQSAKNRLAGFTEQHWQGFDMRQKRLAAATVLQAVIIHPVPKGRASTAPYDPTLLELVFREPH